MTAFTNAETTLIYELLDFFEGGTYDFYSYISWPGGKPTSAPFGSQVDFATAKTRLETIVTAIEAADAASSDGRRVRISQILSEYSDVSLDVATLQSGGGAGQPGSRYNPDKHRAHLRNLLERILGFALHHGPLKGFNLGGAWQDGLR